MSLPLNTYIYATVTPDQVRHRLTDDGWSTFEFGSQRIQISRGDLTRVRSARELAQQIAAAATWWDKDLELIEAGLVEAENAKVAAENDKVTAEAPKPREDPPAASAPAADEPYGGDDPALDAKVQAVADMPETHRKPKDSS